MTELRRFSYVGGIVPPEWVREPIPGAWFEEGSGSGLNVRASAVHRADAEPVGYAHGTAEWLSYCFIR